VALAAAGDVEARLGRALTAAEQTRADGLLKEASALVIGFLGCDPTDTSVEPATVPDPVTIVTSRMVARVFQQDAQEVPLGSDATTQQVGPFARTTRFAAGSTSGAPWLGASDKTILKPYRCGFVSLGISTSRTGRYRRDV
jgi:hypothetical protein